MDKIAVAETIMTEFAARTGLTMPSVPPRRYLWTDSFAVCNYLELYRRNKNKDHLHTGLTLVDDVHQVLGRYSESDPRRGWISGLAEEEGARHPTAGGLRIGKRGDERGADEPFDEQLEWERDGQYFHYLTKWMHTLERVARVTGQSNYLVWAMELARTASRAFTYSTDWTPSRRMVWKMSIDLSRPQVSSMGQHDPLDGLITFKQLESAASRLTDVPDAVHLIEEIEEFRAMCSGMCWSTEDPLGIGGLLVDAFRLAQLIKTIDSSELDRLALLIGDAVTGLEVFVRRGHLRMPATHRLAFRELGLSIGVHAIEGIEQTVDQYKDLFNSAKLHSNLARLSGFRELTGEIEHFWMEPDHWQASSWTEHEDINSVMLATSLVPEGYLGPA